MLNREDLFAEYQAAIVSAYDPYAPDEPGWSDPALFAAMRDQACVVMTAWNPGFRRPSLAVNATGNLQLYDRLLLEAREIWPAENSSPDGRFREPGFLIWDMQVDLGLAIAAEFSQFAIYVYSSQGERSVVACDGR